MLHEFMETYYPSVHLDLRLWEKWPYKEHRDLAKEEYQFLENGEYNEVRFSQAYEEIMGVLHELFETNQQLLLVVNKYLLPGKTSTDKVLKGIIKDPKRAIFEGNRFLVVLEEEEWLIDQVAVTTKRKNIQWQKLLFSLLNQDFPDRKPRFKTKCSYDYPDVYFLDPVKGSILHIYDDRGYELFFPSEAIQKAFLSIKEARE